MGWIRPLRIRLTKPVAGRRHAFAPAVQGRALAKGVPMTVRKAAMVGLIEGKGAARAAAGVVAPHRKIPSPALLGRGAIRPSGGAHAGLADVVGALAGPRRVEKAEPSDRGTAKKERP